MDRSTRSCDPPLALRCGAARCRGAVIDRPAPADRKDASSDRQAFEDAHGAGRYPGSRSDRGLCPPVSLSAQRRCPLVRRCSGWPAQSRPCQASRRFGKAPAWIAGHSDAARAAAQLRDAFAGEGRGPESAPGAAWPCKPVLDADLYGGGRGATSRCLSPRPPPRLSRGPVEGTQTACRGAPASGVAGGRDTISLCDAGKPNVSQRTVSDEWLQCSRKERPKTSL